MLKAPRSNAWRFFLTQKMFAFFASIFIMGEPNRCKQSGLATGALSSVGRAPRLHRGGQEFESPRVHQKIDILPLTVSVAKFPLLQYLLYCSVGNLLLPCNRKKSQFSQFPSLTTRAISSGG